MVEYYPDFLSGQTPTAELFRSALPIVARKTADTSRASTTTVTADPHLTFEVDANAHYIWDGWLSYFADPAADMQLDFTVPTGAEGEWSVFAAGSGTLTSGTAGYSIRTESNDVAAARNIYGTSDANHGAVLNGLLRVGSTAGTFSLDWAQVVSSATAAVLYTDSWIRLQRIA